MSDVLERFEREARIGPFGKMKRDDSRTNAEVFSSLSPEDQQLVNAVCAGTRRRALICCGDTLYLFEHDDAAPLIDGRRYGYTYRSVPFSGAASRPSAGKPQATARTEAPGIGVTLSPAALRGSSFALAGIALVAVLLLFGGEAGPSKGDQQAGQERAAQGDKGQEVILNTGPSGTEPLPDNGARWVRQTPPTRQNRDRAAVGSRSKGRQRPNPPVDVPPAEEHPPEEVPRPATVVRGPREKETAPASEGATVAAVQAVPAERESAPAQIEVAPASEHAGLAVMQAVPVERESTPAQKETAPASEHAGLAVMQAVPVERKSAPAQTAPALTETTSAREEAAGKKTVPEASVPELPETQKEGESAVVTKLDDGGIPHIVAPFPCWICLVNFADSKKLDADAGTNRDGARQTQ